MEKAIFRDASAEGNYWATASLVQLNRIKENILPFFLIGLAAGFVIGTSTKLNEMSWLNIYLNYANISIDYAATSSSVLSEHLAPTTLMILLVSIGVSSAMYRIIFGAMEAAPIKRRGPIFALENFASLLAIAWLGIMLGLLLPAAIYEGWRTAAKFAFLAIYPAIYLFEVSAVTALMYCELKYRRPRFENNLRKWRMQTRLEGLIILAVAIALLTYYKQYNEFIHTTLPNGVRWVFQQLLFCNPS